MKKHIELEVALEIIMAQIALKMFELEKEKDIAKIKKLENELKELIELQQRAYKADSEAVETILRKDAV